MELALVGIVPDDAEVRDGWFGWSGSRRPLLGGATTFVMIGVRVGAVQHVALQPITLAWNGFFGISVITEYAPPRSPMYDERTESIDRVTRTLNDNLAPAGSAG